MTEHSEDSEIMRCEHQSEGSVVAVLVVVVVEMVALLSVAQESMQEETLCDGPVIGFSTSS